MEDRRGSARFSRLFPLVLVPSSFPPSILLISCFSMFAEWLVVRWASLFVCRLVAAAAVVARRRRYWRAQTDSRAIPIHRFLPFRSAALSPPPHLHRRLLPLTMFGAVPPPSLQHFHDSAMKQRHARRDREDGDGAPAPAASTASHRSNVGGDMATASAAAQLPWPSATAATAIASPTRATPSAAAAVSAHASPSRPSASASSSSSVGVVACVPATAGFGRGVAPRGPVPSSSTSSSSSSSSSGFHRPASASRPSFLNEEVILFRSPSDASHLVLFNLPTRPFVHPFYDLRTVAKARAAAEEAMRRERDGRATTDTAAHSAAAAATAAAAAPSAVPLGAGSAAAFGGTLRPSSAPVGPPPSGAALCATYHALHLLNVERVLHAISKKFGLVHELSVHCRARDSDSRDGGGARQSRHAPHAEPDEVDCEGGACALVEAFESGFNLWAFVKYYSVLHAAHAHRELNRTTLVPGQRIKARMIHRNAHSNHSPTKATNAAAATTAATPNAGTAPAASTAAGTASGASPRSWYPLAHHRCLDVCNYFLGFNNWNCEIHSIRKYDHQLDEELMDGERNKKTIGVGGHRSDAFWRTSSI